MKGYRAYHGHVLTPGSLKVSPNPTPNSEDAKPDIESMSATRLTSPNVSSDALEASICRLGKIASPRAAEGMTEIE